jgi:hypothetical protein
VDLAPGRSRRERHQPPPCSQQVWSSVWASRRNDFTPVPRSRSRALVSRRIVPGSRAPVKGMNPTRHTKRAANSSSARRVTRSIAPGPSRRVVIGNNSRPPRLSASSQDCNGWVAPALAKITSAGSNEVPAPSALMTVTFGQGASAVRAVSANVASISIAVTLPVEPTSSAAIPV